MNDKQKYTVTGTNIEEVKRQNDNSGLTYNEVKEVLARTGGKGTAIYSDTDPKQVGKANTPSAE